MAVGGRPALVPENLPSLFCSFSYRTKAVEPRKTGVFLLSQGQANVTRASTQERLSQLLPPYTQSALEKFSGPELTWAPAARLSPGFCGRRPVALTWDDLLGPSSSR